MDGDAPSQPACAAFGLLLPCDNDRKPSRHRNFTQHHCQWSLSTLPNPGPNLTEVPCSHPSKLSGGLRLSKVCRVCTRTHKLTCMRESQCIQSASNGSAISNNFTRTRNSVTVNSYFTAPTTHDSQPSSFWKAWTDYSNKPGVKTQIQTQRPQVF